MKNSLSVQKTPSIPEDPAPPTRSGSLWAAFVHLLKANRSLLANAASMLGTMLLTSGLGFVYWWVAARQFPPAAVGLASTFISSMMLLGNISMVGLGTLVMGEISRYREQLPAFIMTALMVSGSVGLVLGTAFAVLMPTLSSDLNVLVAHPWNVGIFALGVALTASSLVLDQALIGMWRGKTQLWRNGVFAVTKLIILIGAGLLFVDGDGMLIYLTWLAGIVLSLLVFVQPTLIRGQTLRGLSPQLGLLRGLGKSAVGHHIINLALQAPPLLLPLIITLLYSPELTASFYISLMIVSIIFFVPTSLTTVLYAVSAAEPGLLAQKLRFTLRTSIPTVAAMMVGLLILADFILGLFGADYAAQGSGLLRLLAVSALFGIVKHHVIAICRVQKWVIRAAPLVVFFSGLQLTLASVGVLLGGLTGLGLGWLIASSIEALTLSRVVYRAASAPPAQRSVRRVPR